MTLISIQLLCSFLNAFKPKGRIADYGGTSKIGSDIINQALALDRVTARKAEGGKDLTIILNGVPKKKNPEYIVLDYDNGIDLAKPIKGKKFDAGICMDLLEHTENPFIVAKNISNSLNKGAVLFVTAPFVWELHRHPIDCWRFCPQGLTRLFPDMKPVELAIVRDRVDEEDLPRSRVVAVFKKK